MGHLAVRTMSPCPVWVLVVRKLDSTSPDFGAHDPA